MVFAATTASAAIVASSVILVKGLTTYPGQPWTHSISQAGLELLHDPSVSASWMLRLYACATTPGRNEV